MKKLVPPPNAEYERAVIDLFMLPDRRERLYLFQERRREQLIHALHTAKFLDREVAIPIVGPSSAINQTLGILKKHGASDECYAISAMENLDRRNHKLADALREVFGTSIETLLYCPGTGVAYYEAGGYEGRYILHRKRAK